MKPYQFYRVARFPDLEQGKSVKSMSQTAMFGEKEDVETELSLVMQDYEKTFSLLRVKSQIPHKGRGFIKRLIDDQVRQFDFNEYLENVEFNMFGNLERAIVVFQASKEDCRGAYVNMNRKLPGLELQELRVDFEKVAVHHKEYVAAWFRKVSTLVSAANVSGDGIQNDALFKLLLSQGKLSNVTIPWIFEGGEHEVMVTSRGGLVLVQNYKDAVGFELRLILDVYDKLLTKVMITKTGKSIDEDDISP